jgi:hypothetical protein
MFSARRRHRAVNLAMTAVRMMTVPVVDVVGVPVVRHGEVPATRPLGVRMGGVLMVVRAAWRCVRIGSCAMRRDADNNFPREAIGLPGGCSRRVRAVLSVGVIALAGLFAGAAEPPAPAAPATNTAVAAPDFQAEIAAARAERDRRLKAAAERLGRLTGEPLAAPAPAANARPPLWASAPVVEGYEGVSFARLSDFPFVVPETLLVRTNADGALLPQIPREVLALDGRKVAVRGYMQPLQLEGGYAREFILARDPGTCCFGAEPQFNHYLLVRCVGRGDRPVRGVPPVQGVPITVVGTLRVGEHRQQGWLTDIYQLDAEDVLKPGP